MPGSNANSNATYNSNASESIYALYSSDYEAIVTANLETAEREGWYWPQVYYYLVDELEDAINEIGDSDVRGAIYNVFINRYHGRGNYEDYFNYIEDWDSGLYRQYMNVPPDHMNQNARNRHRQNGLNQIRQMELIPLQHTIHRPQPQLPNNHYTGALQGLYMNALPRNATNAITNDPIEEGQNMVNFHGEFDQGRFYTRSTYNSINPKRNPYTRRNILPENVVPYRARFQGGKRRKASKKGTRKTNRR